MTVKELVEALDDAEDGCGSGWKNMHERHRDEEKRSRR
jgi:hypothetical protein